MYDDYEEFDELGADTGVFLEQDWEEDAHAPAMDAPWMSHIAEGGMDDMEDRVHRLMVAAGYGTVALEPCD